jgi:hypothetical protein
VAGANDMNENVRRFIAKNAENVFDRMSKEKP